MAQDTLRPAAAVVPLTKGMVAIIDEADLQEVGRYRWRVSGRRNKGAQSPIHYYAVGQVEGHSVYLHRFILKAPAGMDVDHVNGNRLDCRRSNLRVCSRQDNLRNRHRTWGLSRFRGVRPDRRTGRFYSSINVDGRSIYLGAFDTELEAAAAYDVAALTYFGEFASLNLPGAAAREVPRSRRDRCGHCGRFIVGDHNSTGIDRHRDTECPIRGVS